MNSKYNFILNYDPAQSMDENIKRSDAEADIIVPQLHAEAKQKTAELRKQLGLPEEDSSFDFGHNVAPMNHYPWDGGVISDIFKGTRMQQNTIKADCGRRVKFANADMEKPVTCPECQVVIADRKAFVERMSAEDTLRFANRLAGNRSTNKRV